MGYVYLIGQLNEENKYKIGSTRAKDINTRLKQLQTGNPNPLILKDFHETDRPFKMEAMLHNKYQFQNVNGEWYELDENDIKNFKNTCKDMQKIMDSLKENPFF